VPSFFFFPRILYFVRGFLYEYFVLGREEAYTGCWWGNLSERDDLGDPGLDGRIILRWIFRKGDVGVWTGLSWFLKETGGGEL
jgi:hypothetical protein